jgi:hypothetical protein
MVEQLKNLFTKKMTLETARKKREEWRHHVIYYLQQGGEFRRPKRNWNSAESGVAGLECLVIVIVDIINQCRILVTRWKEEP